MPSPTTKKNQPKGGPSAVAEILKGLDESEREALLRSLERADAKLVTEVRKLLFTWEDVAKIDEALIQPVLQSFLREVPRATLIMALRGASEAMVGLFSKNLPSRLWQEMSEQVAALGPQKRSDVEKAQAELSRMAEALVTKAQPSLK
jgi:flagellar motor switch protein FliG